MIDPRFWDTAGLWDLHRDTGSPRPRGRAATAAIREREKRRAIGLRYRASR